MMRARRRTALGAARGFDFEAGKIHEVEEQQLAFELAAHLQKDFQREQCLQRTERAGHGTQDARFRTIAHHAIGERIRPKAAQARIARLRFVDLELPFVLIHAGKHGGLLRQHGGIIDQILGAKIVAAVDHDVVTADQFQRVIRAESERHVFRLEPPG